MSVVLHRSHHLTSDTLAAVLPFLVSALLILINSLATPSLLRRAKEYYEHELDSSKVTEEQRRLSLQPDNLAEIGNWFIDGGSIITGFTGPIVGWLLLTSRVNASIFNLIYAVAFLCGLGSYFLFIECVLPAGYSQRKLGPSALRPIGVPPMGPVTPVAATSIIINLLATIAILLTGAKG